MDMIASELSKHQKLNTIFDIGIPAQWGFGENSIRLGLMGDRFKCSCVNHPNRNYVRRNRQKCKISTISL